MHFVCAINRVKARDSSHFVWRLNSTPLDGSIVYVVCRQLIRGSSPKPEFKVLQYNVIY